MNIESRKQGARGNCVVNKRNVFTMNKTQTSGYRLSCLEESKQVMIIKFI
jgi:hypothetical protein